MRVAGARLDVKVPQANGLAVRMHHYMFMSCYRKGRDTGEVDQWTTLTIEGLNEYIRTHKTWSKSRKQELTECLDRWAHAAMETGHKSLFTKTDELLLFKVMQEEHLTVVGLKFRPIFPLVPIHVPYMLVSIPFKKYIGRVWFLRGSFIYRQGRYVLNARWVLEDLDSDPLCHDLLGVFAYFASYTPYMLGMTMQRLVEHPAVLSSREYRRGGMGVPITAAHGDDNLTYVVGDGALRSYASDLAKCDLTCHEAFQKFVVEFENESHCMSSIQEDVLELKTGYLETLTGEFRYTVNDETSPLYFQKATRTTNTGQPNTAQLAAMVQFVNYPATIEATKNAWESASRTERLAYLNQPEPRYFKAGTEASWSVYGLLPEFEPGGNFGWSGHSFLGRLPVFSNGRLQFVDLSLAKKFLFHPDPVAVYGKSAKVADHLAVLCRDPDIDASPISRAFAEHFAKVAVSAGITEARTDENLVKYEKYLTRTDAWRLEVTQAAAGEPPTYVKDPDFFNALTDYLWEVPNVDADAVIEKVVALIDELKAAPARFPVRLEHSGELITLRYRSQFTPIITDNADIMLSEVAELCVGTAFARTATLVMKRIVENKPLGRYLRLRRVDLPLVQHLQNFDNRVRLALPKMENNAKKQRIREPKKKKKNNTRKRKGTVKGKANLGFNRASAVSGAAKPNRNPLALMERKLSGQDAGIAAYLLGITTPSLPCRVPVVLGEFELDTNTYSYVFNGAISCTAGGFGYVAACLDGWVENGNDAGPNSQFCSFTTGGYPVWTHVAGGAATTTIATGGASGIDHAKVQMPVLDAAFNSASRYRMTSVILSFWPDSPATTTQGDLCIAALASDQAAAQGALNNVNFATVAGYPQEFVSHMEIPLPNWESGVQSHAIPIAYSENCFVIQYMPATGATLAGAIGAVAIVTGAASGQTFRYRIEYKYETTAPITFQTGAEATAAHFPPSNSADLVPHLQQMRPASTMKAPAKALPALPLHAMKKVDRPMFDKVVADATASANSGLSTLGSALGSAVSSGLKHIPYVGGFLSGAFDSLFG